MWVSTEAISCPFCFPACSTNSDHPIPRSRNISPEYLFKGEMVLIQTIYYYTNDFLSLWSFQFLYFCRFFTGKKTFYLHRMKVKIFAGLATLFFFSLSRGKGHFQCVQYCSALRCFFIETFLEIDSDKKHLSSSARSVTHVK